MTAHTEISMREAWLNGFVDRARPTFEAAGFPIPINLRVSVGLPSTGYRSNVIGECFAPVASADGHFEIFINPRVSEGDARMADILTHELCHAASGDMGHGRAFGKLARALGLEGPLRATTAGPVWFAWATPILEALGPMDFGALATMAPRKKKATFLLKVECPDCGLLARMTKSHILPHTHLNCPNPDCDGVMIAHMGDDDDAGE